MDVGRYKIRRHIARGGMSDVFEAVVVGASGFERKVVIKRLHASEDPSQTHERAFLDEALLLSHLHHGNIVSVVDSGIWDGRPFHVLEFVDGVDAAQLVHWAQRASHDPGLPLEIALIIAMEVAHALSYAHEARDATGEPLGIVHRDVKPSNVLVSYGGDVKLTDFGIALGRGRLEKTRAGFTKGTLAFMSPEQAFGELVDARSDIFQLGCFVFALVRGDSPIGDDGLRFMRRGREIDLGPTLSDDVRAIVAKAIRAKRDERYPTARQMADDLGHALFQRIGCDPRAYLARWMGTMRRPAGATVSTPTPSRKKVDEMFQLDLMCVEVTHGVRRFETRAQGNGSASEPDTVGLEPLRAQATSSPGSSESHRGLVHPARQARVSPRALAGLAIAASVFVLVFAWWKGQDPRTEQTIAIAEVPHSTPPALPATTPSVAIPLDTNRYAKTDTIDVDHKGAEFGDPKADVVRTASTPVSVVSIQPPPDGQAALQTSSRRKPTTAIGPRARDKTPSPSDRSSVDKGYLVVGGERAIRAEIFVDGRSMGYAPKRIELPIGRHEVRLLLADGVMTPVKPIVISGQHTQSAALRWIID